MELLGLLFTNVTFLLLIGGLAVFGILAAKQQRFNSFQFQMSAVLIVLIVSEIIDVMFDYNYIENHSLEHLGSIIHVCAMAGIALIFWVRFFYSKKTQKTLVDEIQK